MSSLTPTNTWAESLCRILGTDDIFSLLYAQRLSTMSENPGRSDEVAKSVLREIGLVTIYHSPRDIKLLYLQRFVPLFAYGSSTLILVSYLAALGIGEERAGLFMTLTLAGDVLISFALTLFADRMGRRTVLALGSLLMTASGVVFGISGNYWVLLVAAIFGVISPRYGHSDALQYLV